ncbi:MAG: methyltransferase domain-containing protein [Crocinitomix sp.]|nr:methyltransferase domain-containing protein [Crocinitomix sp.]
MSKENVQTYYNEIAQNYDSSRFSNTYGSFIDKQERIFLDRHVFSKNTLNLGCGTGRFMEYCSTGIDFSAEMLKIAKENFPEGEYFLGNADTTPFDNHQFDTVICFHVLMHLTPTETEAIFREVNRILKPDGVFIFDYPSAERRKLSRYKAVNWHGGNAFRKKAMRGFVNSQNWKELKRKGVLFLPLHQFPKKLRKVVFGMDQLITKSPLKQYSSYLIHAVQKNKL